ncbi:long-chain fatty acid--CoA ligase [Stakelama tenebrarum]|uniref:long-chain fatty acid--CoA ligase n=1 Tax=Stakelama tenebrarum TaxID=2711215 RepID=UPI001D18BF24|nr:long-chain fatty acid--CoA ligase [Sphingosinithalassobacter tenebrarum]
MIPWSLTMDKLIDHAARWHGSAEIVARDVEDMRRRTDWAALRDQARRATNALRGHGVVPGDRLATFAMNGDRHLAAWFGIMNMGAICHTLNPRLSDEQLAYVVNHAGDRIILADSAFRDVITRVRPHCPCVERVLWFDDDGADGWDEWIGSAGTDCVWGDFTEETPAGLCYTSGTTGRPKGVVYTHRSNYLHTLMILQPDVFDISARTSLLLAVPMFHANAWGLCFAAAAAGSKLVLPGPRLDGAALYELLEEEAVTLTAGVPTVWQTLLQFIDDNGLRLSTLKRVMVGGARCPERLIRDFAEHGVEVQHNWGMTETSPLGTAGMPTAAVAALDDEAQLQYKLTQGRVPLGVDIAIFDAEGSELPRDGEAVGFLGVRGHSVIERYYRQDDSALDAHGYFDTGDIGTIDSQGYLRLTDRAKDAIKSGGEWISSSEIESVALNHPSVAIAAALAVPHPKWGERPMLVVQLKPGAEPDADGLREVLVGGLAKWAVPDEIRFHPAIPVNGTGKIDKVRLRRQLFGDAPPQSAALAGA